MKTVLRIVAAILTGLLMTVSPAAIAQLQAASADIVQVSDFPVSVDRELGLATASIGAGRLHQLDATLIEIPPGGVSPPSRHLTEEILYVVSGRGHTNMWLRPGAGMQRYEWKAGDLLSPSLNAWHQHFNSSATEPVRYVSITNAPMVKNIFGSQELVASGDLVFEERWQYSISQQPEYVPEGGFESSEVVRMRVGHLLPDLPKRTLKQRRKGAWGITILPEGDLAGNHILEMEVREKDGEEFTDEEAHLHRHPWEVVYIVLDGQGYSTMQREGESRRRVDWKTGDLFIAEANELHDNRSQQDTRTRYLQVKASGYFRNVGNVGGIVVEEDDQHR